MRGQTPHRPDESHSPSPRHTPTREAPHGCPTPHGSSTVPTPLAPPLPPAVLVDLLWGGCTTPTSARPQHRPWSRAHGSGRRDLRGARRRLPLGCGRRPPRVMLALPALPTEPHAPSRCCPAPLRRGRTLPPSTRRARASASRRARRTRSTRTTARRPSCSAPTHRVTRRRAALACVSACESAAAAVLS